MPSELVAAVMSSDLGSSLLLLLSLSLTLLLEVAESTCTAPVCTVVSGAPGSAQLCCVVLLLSRFVVLLLSRRYIPLTMFIASSAVEIGISVHTMPRRL